jgi:hypothetical protein
MPFFATNDEEKNKETKDKFKTQNIYPQAPSDLSSSINGEYTPNKVSLSFNTMTPLKLAQLIFVVGHIALNMIIYGENLEATIKKNLTKKKKVKILLQIKRKTIKIIKIMKIMKKMISIILLEDKKLK